MPASSPRRPAGRPPWSHRPEPSRHPWRQHKALDSGIAKGDGLVAGGGVQNPRTFGFFREGKDGFGPAGLLPGATQAWPHAIPPPGTRPEPGSVLGEA